jgi:hypothetical protein
MHPLQGASFLSTPLQGGILKPPALRVVADYGEQYRCNMRMPSDEEKKCDGQSASMNNLIDGYTDDTEQWIGKRVKAWLNREKVAGKFVVVLSDAS